MKKSLLSLFAFLLTATAVNAQVTINKQVTNLVETAPQINITKPITIGGMHKSVKKNPARQLADNQKYVGLEGAETPTAAIGLPGYEITDFAQLIPASYYEDYVGCKIVGIRFLTAVSTRITPYLMSLKGNNLTDIATAKSIKTQATTYNSTNKELDINWNEVTFSQPYTITSGTDGILVSFTYTQSTKNDGKQYDEECYPFMASSNSDQDALIFGNGDFGTGSKGWAAINDTYGLCVQLIVEKEGGFVDDLYATGMYTYPMFKKTETLPFSFNVKNLGNNNVNGEFSILVDNKEVGTIESEEAIGTSWIEVQGEVDLTSLNLADGVHTISAVVKSMNGEKPTGNVDNDITTATFRVYSASTARQYNLLEHFTSWTCKFCPIGYDVLNALQKQRNDVAWVAIHCDQDRNNPDPHTIEDGQYIASYSQSGFPSANFNRFNLSGNKISTGIAFSGSATSAASNLSKVFDQEDQLAPSQVHLTMNSTLTDSKLVITVKGTGVQNASAVLSDAVLGLYITEDGLTGRQYGKGVNKNSWYETYDHVNTLIATATDNPWGDNIVWNGDNFEKTYEYDIPAKTIDYDNGKTLNAVAYVSLPYVLDDGENKYFNADLDNVWVNQCLFMDINKGETSGVKSINGSDSTATVVARYAADGTQISAPVKGINILKMSDGTTRKVLVNK